ncbi:unnamed protein product, partial [Prorocentrum cordatum]
LFLPGPIHRVLAQSLLFKTRGAGEGSLPSLHSPPVARARTNRKRPAKNEDLVRLQVADAPPAPGWRISRSMQRCDGCAGRRRSRSTQRHLAAGVKKERARETGSRGWARRRGGGREARGGGAAHVAGPGPPDASDGARALGGQARAGGLRAPCARGGGRGPPPLTRSCGRRRAGWRGGCRGPHAPGLQGHAVQDLV